MVLPPSRCLSAERGVPCASVLPAILVPRGTVHAPLASRSGTDYQGIIFVLKLPTRVTLTGGHDGLRMARSRFSSGDRLGHRRPRWSAFLGASDACARKACRFRQLGRV